MPEFSAGVLFQDDLIGEEGIFCLRSPGPVR